MKLTHETYQQAVGAEFGKTILGFFGDETDYNGIIPWTAGCSKYSRNKKATT